MCTKYALNRKLPVYSETKKLISVSEHIRHVTNISNFCILPTK